MDWCCWVRGNRWEFVLLIAWRRKHSTPHNYIYLQSCECEKSLRGQNVSEWLQFYYLVGKKATEAKEQRNPTCLVLAKESYTATLSQELGDENFPSPFVSKPRHCRAPTLWAGPGAHKGALIKRSVSPPVASHLRNRTHKRLQPTNSQPPSFHPRLRRAGDIWSRGGRGYTMDRN